MKVLPQQEMHKNLKVRVFPDIRFPFFSSTTISVYMFTVPSEIIYNNSFSRFFRITRLIDRAADCRSKPDPGCRLAAGVFPVRGWYSHKFIPASYPAAIADPETSGPNGDSNARGSTGRCIAPGRAGPTGLLIKYIMLLFFLIP
jgi:hypothetical protein